MPENTMETLQTTKIQGLKGNVGQTPYYFGLYINQMGGDLLNLDPDNGFLTNFMPDSLK